MLRWKDEGKTIIVVVVETTEVMKNLAQLTLDVQDACNMCGVASSFAEAMETLSHSEQNEVGSDYVAQHPITRLWIDKLEHLSRLDQSSKSTDYMLVMDMAEGKNIEFDVRPDSRDLESWYKRLE